MSNTLNSPEIMGLTATTEAHSDLPAHLRTTTPDPSFRWDEESVESLPDQDGQAGPDDTATKQSQTQAAVSAHSAPPTVSTGESIENESNLSDTDSSHSTHDKTPVSLGAYPYNCDNEMHLVPVESSNHDDDGTFSQDLYEYTDIERTEWLRRRLDFVQLGWRESSRLTQQQLDKKDKAQGQIRIRREIFRERRASKECTPVTAIRVLKESPLHEVAEPIRREAEVFVRKTGANSEQPRLVSAFSDTTESGADTPGLDAMVDAPVSPINPADLRDTDDSPISPVSPISPLTAIPSRPPPSSRSMKMPERRFGASHEVDAKAPHSSLSVANRPVLASAPEVSAETKVRAAASNDTRALGFVETPGDRAVDSDCPRRDCAALRQKLTCLEEALERKQEALGESLVSISAIQTSIAEKEKEIDELRGALGNDKWESEQSKKELEVKLEVIREENAMLITTLEETEDRNDNLKKELKELQAKQKDTPKQSGQSHPAAAGIVGQLEGQARRAFRERNQPLEAPSQRDGAPRVDLTLSGPPPRPHSGMSKAERKAAKAQESAYYRELSRQIHAPWLEKIERKWEKKNAARQKEIREEAEMRRLELQEKKDEWEKEEKRMDECIKSLERWRMPSSC